MTYIGGVRKTAEDCKRIKNIFLAKKIPFEEVDLGITPEKRKEMEEGSGLKELPQVFLSGEFIGVS